MREVALDRSDSRQSPIEKGEVIPLSVLLIVIGIAVAVLVHWGLGILLVIIGLVLLVFDYAGNRRIP